MEILRPFSDRIIPQVTPSKMAHRIIEGYDQKAIDHRLPFSVLSGEFSDEDAFRVMDCAKNWKCLFFPFYAEAIKDRQVQTVWSLDVLKAAGVLKQVPGRESLLQVDGINGIEAARKIIELSKRAEGEHLIHFPVKKQ